MLFLKTSVAPTVNSTAHDLKVLESFQVANYCNDFST
jgi:hypothetical protein